jgi:hypothetical protein
MRYVEIIREDDNDTLDNLADLADQKRLAADKLAAQADVMKARKKLADKQKSAAEIVKQN